jgi:tRNA(Ile)-lysidine synthase
MLRGAGAAGLSAMRCRGGRVIRPLLAVTRAELRDYLVFRHASFREDASNFDTRITRNRIRHDLLPHLRRYSPKIVEALAREAEIACGDEEYLAGIARRLGGDLVNRVSEGVEVDAVGLSALPSAMARRVVRDMLVRVAGSDAVSFEQIERLRDMAKDGPRRVDLRGCRAERVADVISLVRRKGRGIRNPASSFAYRLQVPGEVSVPEVGLSISARSVEAVRSFEGDLSAESLVAVVSASATPPLAVRSWQPGDWFRPLGMDGHRKKLQDLFVDRKVDRGDRARIPIVLDDLDRIIWVVGHGVSNDFRVTAGAASMLVLKVQSLGDNL